MVQAKPKLQTFDDYLAYAEGMEAYHELTDEELIEVPPESDETVMIARAMDRALSDLVGFQRVRTHQLAVEMPGQPKNRFSDITVLLPEHLEQLNASGQSVIRLDMHPPMLVMEVVSPGAENHRRDYIDKRNQYEWRGIPEYWIVDPVEQKVTVLFLMADGYEETVFVEDEVVVSQEFSDWALTAAELLLL